MAIEAGTKFITYSPDVDLKEKRSSGPNSKTKVYTIEEIVAEASTGTYLEVDITQGNILAMGTTPIDILPVLTGNEYYVIEEMLMEVTPGTAGYVTTSDAYAIESSTYFTLKPNILSFTGAAKVFVLAKGMSTTLVTSSVPAIAPDPFTRAQTCRFSTWNGDDPTSADGGTIKVKVTYSVKTLG
jgi:hypothetical protein